jgi:hypothetical protein
MAAQAGAVDLSPGIAKNNKVTECLDLQNPACLHQSLTPTLLQVAARFQSQPYSLHLALKFKYMVIKHLGHNFKSC